MEKRGAPPGRASGREPVSVQSFAGGIWNKYKSGKGRMMMGAASMIHTNRQSAPSVVHQRVNVQVTAPREPLPSQKLVRTQSDRKKPNKEQVVIKEKVTVEKIVLRDVIHIMDAQRRWIEHAVKEPIIVAEAMEQNKSVVRQPSDSDFNRSRERAGHGVGQVKDPLEGSSMEGIQQWVSRSSRFMEWYNRINGRQGPIEQRHKASISQAEPAVKRSAGVEDHIIDGASPLRKQASGIRLKPLVLEHSAGVATRRGDQGQAASQAAAQAGSKAGAQAPVQAASQAAAQAGSKAGAQGPAQATSQAAAQAGVKADAQAAAQAASQAAAQAGAEAAAQAAAQAAANSASAVEKLTRTVHSANNVKNKTSNTVQRSASGDAMKLDGAGAKQARSGSAANQSSPLESDNSGNRALHRHQEKSQANENVGKPDKLQLINRIQGMDTNEKRKTREARNEALIPPASLRQREMSSAQRLSEETQGGKPAGLGRAGKSQVQSGDTGNGTGEEERHLAATEAAERAIHRAGLSVMQRKPIARHYGKLVLRRKEATSHSSGTEAGLSQAASRKPSTVSPQAAAASALTESRAVNDKPAAGRARSEQRGQTNESRLPKHELERPTEEQAMKERPGPASRLRSWRTSMAEGAFLAPAASVYSSQLPALVARRLIHQSAGRPNRVDAASPTSSEQSKLGQRGLPERLRQVELESFVRRSSEPSSLLPARREGALRAARMIWTKGETGGRAEGNAEGGTQQATPDRRQSSLMAKQQGAPDVKVEEQLKAARPGSLQAKSMTHREQRVNSGDAQQRSGELVSEPTASRVSEGLAMRSVPSAPSANVTLANEVASTKRDSLPQLPVLKGARLARLVTPGEAANITGRSWSIRTMPSLIRRRLPERMVGQLRRTGRRLDEAAGSSEQPPLQQSAGQLRATQASSPAPLEQRRESAHSNKGESAALPRLDGSMSSMAGLHQGRATQDDHLTVAKSSAAVAARQHLAIPSSFITVGMRQRLASPRTIQEQRLTAAPVQRASGAAGRLMVQEAQAAGVKQAAQAAGVMRVPQSPQAVQAARIMRVAQAAQAAGVRQGAWAARLQAAGAMQAAQAGLAGQSALPAQLHYGASSSATGNVDNAIAAIMAQAQAGDAPGDSSWKRSAAPGFILHRTQGSAQPQETREVKVEAPRELDPEQLQRMIAKLPQLNPDAIADKVYRSLERKMKLEQRRRGF
ncbi:hypothetical protein [Paenibacillus sp. PL2-23]|uniref:hypothetical protein n=1 Tax=Paenibacillus sp. PL2-23 TaxID=2100729 RepID=UPI0030F9EB12